MSKKAEFSMDTINAIIRGDVLTATGDTHEQAAIYFANTVNQSAAAIGALQIGAKEEPFRALIRRWHATGFDAAAMRKAWTKARAKLTDAGSKLFASQISNADRCVAFACTSLESLEGLAVCFGAIDGKAKSIQDAIKACKMPKVSTRGRKAKSADKPAEGEGANADKPADTPSAKDYYAQGEKAYRGVAVDGKSAYVYLSHGFLSRAVAAKADAETRTRLFAAINALCDAIEAAPNA